MKALLFILASVLFLKAEERKRNLFSRSACVRYLRFKFKEMR